jgi:hypothetical protein
MKMILAIDPDVFVAAEFDLASRLSLVGLARKLHRLKFAVDGETDLQSDRSEDRYKIQREYLDLFVRYAKKARMAEDREEWGEILELLRVILSDSDEYRELISNKRPEWLDKLIHVHGCTTGVEPELLGVTFNAQGKGPVLLLVGNCDSSAVLRHRCLRNAKIRWQLISHMKWLDIRFTNDTDIVPAPLKEVPEAKMQDHLLELEAAFYLQGLDPRLRCIPTPPRVGKKIDIYGRKEASNTLTVLVGECKLRKEGNEARKPVEGDNIKQILTNMLAAAWYEQRRLAKSGHPIKKLRIDGALILNTSGFEGLPYDLHTSFENHLNTSWPCNGLEMVESVELRFLKAHLPRGWSSKANWSITELQEFERWQIVFQADENGKGSWHIEAES